MITKLTEKLNWLGQKILTITNLIVEEQRV
jgi:hypothetical protein